jgi:hypothetical protein
MNKPAALSAGLVAIKGNAAPAHDMPPRSASVAESIAETGGLQPLNFRVGAELRREFKTYAAAHDLKLNELLRRSFEAYRKQQGD